MAFQKTVKQTQALGSAGQISKAFHSYCNTFSAVATDENVRVGCFVQAGAKDGEVKGTSGEAIDTKILGVVVKDKYISSCGTEAVNTYKQGDNVTILNAGNIFIEVKKNATATQGKYVHLSQADGALSFEDAIDTTGATKVYTGFRVSVGNADTADGIIEITTANA